VNHPAPIHQPRIHNSPRGQVNDIPILSHRLRPKTSAVLTQTNATASPQMSSTMRFFILLFLICLGIPFFRSISAKPHSSEAVNNAKYLHGIVTVAALPETFRPSSNKKHHNHGKRLIFIGDVHGCFDELVALLEKVKYKLDTGDFFQSETDS